MKKIYVIFLVFCFASNSIALAQQKTPVKKATPTKIKPPKKLVVPPPIVDKPTKVVEAPPPPSMGMGMVMAPMESNETRNFNKNKVCQDCDTLVLKTDKPSIIIYDVKWMANSESKTFREQPTEKDLTNDYFELGGLNKREWDELRKNFPESDFSYHYVYRNTFIKTPNQKQQTVNLLDRTDRHEGFLYWSGKVNDSTINRKTMSRLTELIASSRNEKKTSSYATAFEKDSISIAKFQVSKDPSANLAGNMNKLIQDEVFEEKILPLHLFNFEKVKKVMLQPATDPTKKVSFVFNNHGQLVKFKERSDSTIISYKDGLPSSAVSRYNNMNFYYRGDTVIIKKKNDIYIYKLVDKMFFEVKRFDIEQKNYNEMTLNDGSEIKLSKGDKFCVTKYIDARDIVVKDCYSNTNWQLPLNILHSSSVGNRNNKAERRYFLNEEKNVMVEDANNYKSTKVEYVLADGKPANLKISVKRGEEEYRDGNKLIVSYEYFK
ncbi:MAG: hypothetical protein EOP00_26455 [Pedobacter sp.]|nr:MAG: hypothetical protein EOP00_26455 [Pedobacter sp.]